jgi:3-methyl-2-oxobutanoate hydroxymethyltransferase
MNILDFKRKKKQRSKISMLTCYDYPSARIVSESHVDCVLVGDSVAMAVHGHSNTLMATMEMMELHTAAVARGLGQQFLITDIPFLAHRISRAKTVRHIQRLMQAGAHAIKIEGADAELCQTIQYLVQAGIPVMGHLGLTPQSIHQLGGHKIQGKQETQADLLFQQAKDLEASGCFALVLECIPSSVARRITQALSIPTIGIGAGHETDGQILVWHDMLGLQNDFRPRFVKQFAHTKEILLSAIEAYVTEVQQLDFPRLEHTY